MAKKPRLSAFKQEVEDLVASVKTGRFWRTVALIALGSLLFGYAINALVIPGRLVSGGTTGITLLIYYATGGVLPVGVLFWIVSAPLFVLGWRAMSLKYLVISAIGALLSGLALELTAGVAPIPTSGDPLLGAVVAGLMTGFGVGMYLNSGGSTGGVDIIATVVKKKFAIPMGTTFMMVNAINLGMSAILHDPKVAFYTGVMMLVHSWAVDKAQAGFYQRRAVFIVTDKPDAVAKSVMRTLDRGVTFLDGHGAMSGRATRVVYTVINMVELGRLKDLLFHLDPDAFVAVHDTVEVIGKRFLTWEEAGFHGRSRARTQQAVQAE